jgi:GntR family transcriptional regulator
MAARDPRNAQTSGNGPLYQHVAAVLREEIAAGEYRRGDQLPTEEMLGQRFNVSRITVRGALDLLVAEGLLRRERGRGTFITEAPVEHTLVRLTDFDEDMAEAGLRPASRVVHVAEEPASDDIAGELRLARGATVLRLDRLRLADEQPVAFDVTWLPLRYGRLIDRERLASETIYRQLETTYDIAIVSGTFILEADVLAPEIARQLGVPAGTPSLIIRRTSLAANGEPVYYQTRYYRADRVRYRLELERQRPQHAPRITELAPVFRPQEPGDQTE